MSDDLISRQTAIDDAHSQIWYRLNPNMKERVDTWLVNLPAVQPKQKTGRWIYTNTIGGMRYYGCTICTNQEKDCIADENEIQWYNYCPNCGAKMESDKNDD